MTKRLTPEQAQIVETWHNLIYRFLTQHRLSIDDWYGAAAIGMCKAAAIYNPALGKYSTIAYRCMLNVIGAELRKQGIHAPAALSLDALMEKQSMQEEFIAAPCVDVQDDAITAATISGLSAYQLAMLRLYAAGLTQQDIAARVGIAQTTVSRKLARIRKEVSQYE